MHSIGVTVHPEEGQEFRLLGGLFSTTSPGPLPLPVAVSSLMTPGTYECPAAAVTNDHKLDGLKQQQYILSQSRGHFWMSEVCSEHGHSAKWTTPSPPPTTSDPSGSVHLPGLTDWFLWAAAFLVSGTKLTNF